MSLLLFAVILIVSFVIVRIGAVAFELTGLEWSLAKFQALSCFTGTGFTTRESELITGHPQRRRIASLLIVLGHAGFVTLVAAFVNSLSQAALIDAFSIPFLHLVVPPSLIPLVITLIMIIAVYAFYKIFANSALSNKITDILRKHIAKKEIIKRVTFEELTIATGGYGVSQIEVCNDSPVLDRTLMESGLRGYDITVLAIDREGITMPNPPADTKIFLGDNLICFGKLENIRNKLYVIPK